MVSGQKSGWSLVVQMRQLVKGQGSMIFQVLVQRVKILVVLFHYDIDPLDLVKCIGSRVKTEGRIQMENVCFGFKLVSWVGKGCENLGQMGQKT